MSIKTLKFCLLAIVGMMFHVLVNSQDIRFEHIRVEEGLSDLTVRCIIQDHVGYMWFGTNNGLNRYDGREIVKFSFSPNDPHTLRGNIIYCLYEDTRGNLWVGTWGGGLSLYNRETDTFLTFQHDDSNPGSIGHNDIWSIFEDSRGYLWIGTQQGLERFNYETATFEKHMEGLSLPERSLNLRGKAISSIKENSDGTLWVSLWKHGLLNYDPINRKVLRHLAHEPGNKNSLSTSEINFLYTDSKGSLWIGTYKGDLERLVLSDGVPYLEKYSMGSGSGKISDNRINFIVEDPRGLLWIGTEMGLNMLNKETGETERFFYNADVDATLSSNHLWSGYVSNNGILWVGSQDGGVNIYDPLRIKFTSNFVSINEARQQDEKFVKSIYRDESGILWVGTDHGLNKFSPQGELLCTFLHGETSRSLDIGGVSGIVEDNNGVLWISTWGGGLHFMKKEGNELSRYYQPGNLELPRGLHDLNIQRMIGDQFGNIFIGTSYGHFYRFYPDKDSFDHFLCMDLDSLRGVPVEAICPDDEGKVWIGLGENGGLINLDMNSGKAIRYNVKNNDASHSLSSNDIFCLLNDNDRLWIGTKNGLNMLDKRTGEIILFDEKQGLPGRSVLTLQKDIEGNIWLSTLLGISKFDRSNNHIINYDSKDGAPGNCIVSYKDYNSVLYFGGINGIFSFNPLTVLHNSFLPPVVFTSFKIFNQEVVPNVEGSPLKKTIDRTSKIELNYNQAYFSLEFSALNFTLPEKNQYRYMLEGVDPEWIYSGTRNTAYYTNIEHGSYVFKVQGANNDGLWNEEVKSLEITILPPWWRTLWFKLMVLFLGIASVFMLILIRTSSLRRREQELTELVRLRTQEIENQKIKISKQAKKLHMADQMKIRFFTNISHEFRTPLTLILSPLDKLFADIPPNDSSRMLYTIIKRNTLRLVNLINQFLDISRVEAGVLKLVVTKGDIVEYISRIAHLYNFTAQQKSINYNIHMQSEPWLCYFDGDKIEKILYNLISNAFKNTPSGGEIDVFVEKIYSKTCDHSNVQSVTNESIPEYLRIRVKDTGTGIHEEQLKNIFKRFYQVEGSRQTSHGVGIGLSLTKDLVNIHKGEIDVASKPGEGTEFCVVLPVNEQFFQKHEKVNAQPSHDELKPELIALDEQYDDAASDLAEFGKRSDKPCILIVEDNKDVRLYLENSMKDQFFVILAANGEDGLKKAQKYLPDIIISDVMMPVMDGFEFCEKVKKDMLTCHIPLILLTAKATSTDKLEGIEIGADAYITKPFEIDILKATVSQLMETRKKLYDKYRQELLLQPMDIQIVSADEKLLSRIIKVLNENLSDPNFGVEQLGKEVGLSRTHLYRKIKELTGQTAIEFIRNTRLQVAARLLTQNKVYVSEVTYMCGFKELSYFRKVFKEVYGMSPNEYANNAKNRNLENEKTRE